MTGTPQTRLDQLKHALALGAIDQDTFNALTTASASLTGGGAIAQGAGAQAVGAGGIGIGGNNSGNIAQIVVNIHGDDADKQVEIARATLAATLLAPPAEAARKQAISAYYLDIAGTLHEAAEALRHLQVPHGTCGQMLFHADQLPGVVGDFIGQELASALQAKLRESYSLEAFGAQYFGLPPAEREVKFGQLDEAAGYFEAAARAIRVRR
ncbi:MAG: hypothetical protein ABIV92_02140 [Thermoflexales bacterium]